MPQPGASETTESEAAVETGASKTLVQLHVSIKIPASACERVNGGEKFHLEARESATTVASISFLDGLAPEAHYRRTAHMAA
jgi:hypothetical protein